MRGFGRKEKEQQPEVRYCMDALSKHSISSLNYIFLRGVAGVEKYSPELCGELRWFVENADIAISQNDLSAEYLKDAAEHEFSEAEYIKIPAMFCDKMQDYCRNELNMDDDEFSVICNFYKQIIDGMY